MKGNADNSHLITSTNDTLHILLVIHQLEVVAAKSYLRLKMIQR